MTAVRDPLASLPAGVCLVGFGASWCAPWQLLAPTLEAIAADGVALRRVDVDIFGDTAERFRVICLPTFCLLRDGAEVRRVIGAVSDADLRALVARGAGSSGAASRPRRRSR